MKLKHLLVAAGLLSLFGCLRQEMSVGTPQMDVCDITAPADTLVGQVICEIPVSSNESWSARSGADWLTIISGEENLNPTGVVQTRNITAVLENNEELVPRTTTVTIVSPTESKTIVVTQRAKVNRVSVAGPLAETPDSCSIAAEFGGEIAIQVYSNTDWTVSLDPESTAAIKKQSATGGSRDDVVTVVLKPNYEVGVEKKAVLWFEAADVEPVRFVIHQESNVPFIKADAADMTQTLLPITEEGTLQFNANLAWTAEIVDSNLGNLQLAATEGEAGIPVKLGYTLAGNVTDDLLTAHIKVALKEHPDQNITFTINQRSGIAISFSFMEVTNADNCPLQPVSADYPKIPFTSDNALSLNNLTKEPFAPYKYKVNVKGVDYIFEISNEEFNVQTGYLRLSKGYIKYPAIENYRLTYVEFTTAATNKKYYISSDAEGQNIVGSAQTLGKGVVAIWNLDNTEVNTSYYEYIDKATARTRQENLILIYVK